MNGAPVLEWLLSMMVGALLWGGGGKTGALLELRLDHRGSSRMETGMSGNFLSCLKGVKDTFEAQEGRGDFSQDATVEKGLISR